MRYNEICEGFWDKAEPRYDSKPDYLIDYEEGEDIPVWVNPSKNTFFKIVGKYSARGLIYKTGEVVIWAQANMYHNDVYDQIPLKSEFLIIQFGRDYLAVKGLSEVPIDFHDPEWEPILRNNKMLLRYYGSNMKIEDFNWG